MGSYSQPAGHDKLGTLNFWTIIVGGCVICTISVVGGWDVMITDVTAPIHVWCIAGDISTFPVGDATATMTPDGNAV